MYQVEDLTFVICAYEESPYLEECIQSLEQQSTPFLIIMASSTDNFHIRQLASKYNIPLYLSSGPSDIARDWNFALSCVKTPLAVIAHQDDVYFEKYGEEILAVLNEADHPLIAFSDYQEIRNGRFYGDSSLLRVKRLLLAPLKARRLQKSIAVRRRILSVGNPICCPSVAFCLENLSGFKFLNGMKSNIDWLAWEELSSRTGEFIYVPQKLMAHRIHKGSATTAALLDSTRQQEDLAILKKFWPCWIAKVVENFYKKSESFNNSDPEG